MAATQDQIDQQQRVIMATKQRVEQLLNAISATQQSADTYNRIGLSDNTILADESFIGTGTTRAQYRDAITSIGALQTLLGQGHGTQLEKFAR